MPTFETSGPVELVVDLGMRSDIWVAATDRAEATVEIRPRTATRALDVKVAEQTAVEMVDGRLLVRLRQWRRLWFSDGGAVDVVIEVPIGSSLDLTSGMGDLRADGEFGDVSMRTGMGAVQVGHCRDLRVRTGQGDVDVVRAVGAADVGTGSGKVRLREVDGSAVVTNGNGDTLVGDVVGSLRVKASNGEVVVDHAGGDVSVKSSNGPVRLGEVVRGTTTVATSAGAIEVGVRDGTAAWLDLHTKYGRVRNDLTAADGPPGTDATSTDPVQTVAVRAHSSYDDVTVHRSTRSQQ